MVDAAIYSEMKGGIHPWFTGLAVVGGVYVFGAVGAIYGPLALCVLYVLVNLYTSFMQVGHVFIIQGYYNIIFIYFIHAGRTCVYNSGLLLYYI